MKICVWLILCLSLVACGRPKPSAAPAPLAVVEFAVVEPVSTAGPATEYAGKLERRRQMNLSFRIPGVLTSLTVDAGDRVTKGQVVASIDPTGVQARTTQAETELEKARRDLRRDQQLFDQGFVSRQRLDDRKSAERSALASLSAASFDRRWSNLVAPASGVVLARVAQSGEVVQPGQTVLQVADMNSPLVLRLPVPDRDVSSLRLGQSVQITLDALPGQVLGGQIVKLGEVANTQTGAVEVEVEVPSRPQLRSGMIASAKLALSRSDPGTGVRVPAEALLEAHGNQASVLVLDGEVVRRRSVNFRGFDGDFAIIEGLAFGSRVVTAGAGFVADGQKVQVADAASLDGSGK